MEQQTKAILLPPLSQTALTLCAQKGLTPCRCDECGRTAYAETNPPHGQGYRIYNSQFIENGVCDCGTKLGLFMTSEATLARSKCEICSGNEDVRKEGGYLVCADCRAKAAAYEEKVAARAARMRAFAEKLDQEGTALRKEAIDMVIRTGGTPVLIGHYSEQRHRNYLKRSDNMYRRGIEAMYRAQSLERRAKAAEENRAVSSDDPAALIKLREKLAEMEAEQIRMKEANKLIRKHKGDLLELIPSLVALGFSEADASDAVTPTRWKGVGFPSFKLTNNSGNMRRVKERIAELEAKREMEPVAPETVNGVQIVRDVEDNRLRLVFDGKPSPEIIKLLKSRGFRWSPSNKAWQRQLNNAAEWAAKDVLANMVGGA